MFFFWLLQCVAVPRCIFVSNCFEDSQQDPCLFFGHSQCLANFACINFTNCCQDVQRVAFSCLRCRSSLWFWQLLISQTVLKILSVLRFFLEVGGRGLETVLAVIDFANRFEDFERLAFFFGGWFPLYTVSNKYVNVLEIFSALNVFLLTLAVRCGS